ncbi:hypothetical protein AAY473_027456 [Plecturocebus cupreus]
MRRAEVGSLVNKESRSVTQISICLTVEEPMMGSTEEALSGRHFPTELGLPGFGCAFCETLSPQRFQLLFSLWEWDQQSPTKRAPSPVHSALRSAAPRRRQNSCAGQKSCTGDPCGSSARNLPDFMPWLGKTNINIEKSTWLPTRPTPLRPFTLTPGGPNMSEEWSSFAAFLHKRNCMSKTGRIHTFLDFILQPVGSQGRYSSRDDIKEIAVGRNLHLSSVWGERRNVGKEALSVPSKVDEGPGAVEKKREWKTQIREP